jgi:hypothetical protein
MPHHLAAFHRAFHHAMADFRPGELHDHVRGTRQQARTVSQVPDIEVR